MKLIITEKPSVASEIALIVGAAQRGYGYFEGGGYAVTWALGHLVTLAMPEAYGAKGFKSENLPIIPAVFTLIPRRIKNGRGTKPDIAAVAQLKIIRKLTSECEKIIVATDAGREGELIFRYIYEYIGCTKPFERLWISSLTDKAIREGLANLKIGNQYDNLYLAARARSEADWLIGINATQAVSIAAKHSTYSIGRVQTPTLCMLSERFLDNRKFTPQSFWQLGLVVDDGVKFISEQKWDNNLAATELYQSLKSATEATARKIEVKESIQEPPLLYDLTTLQKEANIRHGFSADKTLSIAQKLYESKLITYPRTGSRYISDDVFAEFPKLFPKLAIKNRHSVYTSKVTDHHALLVISPLPHGLPNDEITIYTMIRDRVFEAFGDPCIKEVTTATIDCLDVSFTAKSTVVKQLGWLAIRGNEEEPTVAINLSDGDILTVSGCSIIEGKTKPKPLYTEATLLGAMEDSGLGTPATRASIIETLFAREYLIRKEKSLIPTEKGLALYYIVRDMRIGDPKMTGDWEATLLQIERGEMTAETFRRSIEIYTRQITAELLEVKIYQSK